MAFVGVCEAGWWVKDDSGGWGSVVVVDVVVVRRARRGRRKGGGSVGRGLGGRRIALRMLRASMLAARCARGQLLLEGAGSRD